MHLAPDVRRGTPDPIPEKTVGGYSLPVLGIGTSGVGSFGVNSSSRGDPTHDAADISGLRSALDAGFSHFDTAEVYAAGHSERLLGSALSLATSPQIKVTTKVLPSHLGYNELLASVRASRERLGRSIDTLLLHSPNHEISLNETTDALRQLIDEGTVRHIGASNHSVESLDKLRVSLETDSRYRLNVCQAHYSLRHREPEASGLLKYCREHNILFCAWRPLEMGMMAKVTPECIEGLTRKYECTPAQLALAWVMNQENVVTLVRSSSPAHLWENRAATGITLTSSESEFLSLEFPEQVLRDARYPLG